MPRSQVRNAVGWFADQLDRDRLVAWLRRDRPAGPGAPAPPPYGPAAAVRQELVGHHELDLVGFLNGARRDDLDCIAEGVELPAGRRDVGQLRADLWALGARAEAEGDLLGPPLQPVPVVLGGRLVLMAAGPGRWPASARWPRPIPDAVAPPAPAHEPETLEELLANADRLVGARLGGQGRNKGAFGSEIAARLGVPERGWSEPDWRGEVEIKTVPVVRDPSGFWRVKEDPAVSMENASPLAKLERVLWIARVADAADSPVLSWYYQECEPGIRRLYRRALHKRPKGGANTTNKGWYVKKTFFADSGFLRALNG